MPIYEQGETYDYDIEIRDEDGTLVDPSSVTITITNPCGTELVTDDNMTNDDTGKYSYDYDIADDATLGEYTTVVDSTATDGSVTKYRNNFFVFDFNIIQKIRRYSGITKTSVSNDDVAGIGMEALKEALDDVFLLHKDVSPVCDPDYGVLFDGSNTTVRTPCTPIADHDFDGTVEGGGGSTACDNDITAYWIDSDYGYNDADVTVINSTTGRIQITQTDGTAIPNDHNGVYITYWTEWDSYDEKIFEDAVSYLAAHHLILRMTEPHRATAADLPSNQKKIELNLERFYRKYRALLSKISKPLCDGL